MTRKERKEKLRELDKLTDHQLIRVKNRHENLEIRLLAQILREAHNGSLTAVEIILSIMDSTED